MKRLISLLLILILIIGAFAGCSNNDNNNAVNKNVNDNTESSEADTNEPDEPRILTVLLNSNDGWVRNVNPFAH